MILQALVHYYETLLKKGLVARPGWTTGKVCWGLDLTPTGELLAVKDLQTVVTNGKKTKLVATPMEVPEQVKRSSGFTPNFLCDTSSYILGVDDNEKQPDRALKCFEAAKKLHLDILSSVSGLEANAICAFYLHWDSSKASEHPALKDHLAEIFKSSGNIIFMLDGEPILRNPEIAEAWEKHREESMADCEMIRCLVTGKEAPLARLHPLIKGVKGAQSSGASLVSFNSPSFESYGRTQGANASVSTYAAYAYGQALNYLVSDKEHCKVVGDTTVVCWADTGETAYQDAFSSIVFSPEGITEDDFCRVVHTLADGMPVDWDGVRLDPHMQYYILGLAPNAGRLSVRFFWQNSFGKVIENVKAHYDRLEIAKPVFDNRSVLSPYWLLQETVNKSAKNPTPSPQLSGDLLRAILNNSRYPATLINGINLRIHAEQNVTRGQAAAIKAYYSKNTTPLCPQEVLTMELNKDSNYTPYVLGRLFFILERLQKAAIKNIKTSIRERFFTGAYSTPYLVYPTLIGLAQHHLRKLDDGLRIYYDSQITDLLGRINHEFPIRLSLPEQGAFELGYYHAAQEFFKTKKDKNESEVEAVTE